MTRHEIEEALTASDGRRVRVTFDDGVIQIVEIGSVDDEGFLHSGPDCADPKAYWTRFESVTSIEPYDDTRNT